MRARVRLRPGSTNRPDLRAMRAASRRVRGRWRGDRRGIRVNACAFVADCDASDRYPEGLQRPCDRRFQLRLTPCHRPAISEQHDVALAAVSELVDERRDGLDDATAE